MSRFSNLSTENDNKVSKNEADSVWNAHEKNISLITELREQHKAADRLIRDLYEGKAAWGARAAAQQQKMKCAYAAAKSQSKTEFWQRLLNHLGHRSPLLTIEPIAAELGPQPGNNGIDALLHLAMLHEQWRRHPEDWLPETDDPRQQIHSLARHLLAIYPVPAFLDSAWFEGFTPDGAEHREWFVHIAIGQNIRRFPALPLNLTEKAAHHFIQSPNEYSVVGALRRGQTLALGGDEFLAKAISESKLARILPDEPFWESVIHFFVNNPTMNTTQASPIIDFIWAHKFGEDCVLNTDGNWSIQDAPEPDFSMKGRKLPALQKRVEEWHEFLSKHSKRPKTTWQPTGIEEFHTQECDSNGVETIWAIVELCSSTALQEDGREMRHCVFTYAANCVTGKISIWSMRFQSFGEKRKHRLLTIEVNMTKRAIVQVRGKANQTLGQMKRKARGRTASELLRRWAKEQRLSIQCGV